MTTAQTTQTLSLKTGDLAYYDSFSGMIPAKVLSIAGNTDLASTRQTVTLQVTVDHRPYRKGEVIETNGIHAVPRRAVCGKYRNRIKPYVVIADTEAPVEPGLHFHLFA